MVLFLVACAGAPPDAPSRGPILGGGMALGDDGSIWLSDPDRSRLVRVDAGGATPIQLPGATIPHRLAIASGVVVAGLRGAGSVALIDRSDLSIRFVPVCAEPRGVDAAPDGTVWVACADGVLVHLDPVAGKVLVTLPVEDDLRDVIDDGGGTVWVSRFRTAEVLRVDRTTGEIVARFRPADIDADMEPVSADVDPYTPSTAWRMRRHPGGGVGLLHQMGAIGALEEGPNGLPPTYYGGCKGIVVTTVTTIDDAGIVESSHPMDVPGVVVDFDYGPDGRLLLAMFGNEDREEPIAVRINPFAQNKTFDTICPVPEALLVVPGAHGTAIAMGPNGPVVAQTEPFGLNGEAVLVPEVATPDAGWDTFHRATVNRASCVACHPEGHEDGRTWQFVVEGFRRTQDVAGVSNTAPFHWGGELATLDDLMHVVHEGRMGSTEAADPSVTVDLAEFLDRVSPYATPPSPTPDLVETGAGLFLSSGCAECHTDPLPTENQDVGTGGSFQVPRLAGVRYRVPLMHDGCAATIRERFDPECGGTDHRDGHLTDVQIDAIVAYLTTL